MSLYKKFASDEHFEVDGVFIDYGDGVSIKIRRAGGANKAYIKALERFSRSHRFQIQSGRLDGEESRRILIKIYAETVVLGWENVTDQDGKPLPFSVENCVRLFTDLPDLFQDVVSQAENAAIFRKSIDEADAKN